MYKGSSVIEIDMLLAKKKLRPCKYFQLLNVILPNIVLLIDRQIFVIKLFMDSKILMGNICEWKNTQLSKTLNL